MGKILCFLIECFKSDLNFLKMHQFAGIMSYIEYRILGKIKKIVLWLFQGNIKSFVCDK